MNWIRYGDQKPPINSLILYKDDDNGCVLLGGSGPRKVSGMFYSKSSEFEWIYSGITPYPVNDEGYWLYVEELDSKE